jgi:hypothetical protein
MFTCTVTLAGDDAAEVIALCKTTQLIPRNQRCSTEIEPCYTIVFPVFTSNWSQNLRMKLNFALTESLICSLYMTFIHWPVVKVIFISIQRGS